MSRSCIVRIVVVIKDGGGFDSAKRRGRKAMIVGWIGGVGGASGVVTSERGWKTG